jgi:hypothetical protein
MSRAQRGSSSRVWSPCLLAILIGIAPSRAAATSRSALHPAQDPAAGGRIGIQIEAAGDGRILVSAVAPEGAAARAGIEAGDVILEVDGDAVQGRAPADVARKIGGAPGTDVTLLLWHTGRRSTEKLVVRRSGAPAPGPEKKPGAEPGPGAPAAVLPAGTVRFQRFGIVDDLAHAEAYRMLVPTGWKSEGKILWDVERKASPASLSVRSRNPDAPETFEFFPAPMFTWSPMLEQMGMRGRYLGCEIARPVDGPLVALRQIVIPRFRPGLLDAQVVASEELPKLAQAAAALYSQPGIPGVVRAGRVRLQYTEGGVAVQEEFACIFVSHEGPTGALWALDQITAFKAKKDELDARMPVFRNMLFSLEPNLEWYADLEAATRILVEGAAQEQAQIMKRVQIETQKNEAIRGTIRAEFESRQAAMARIHDNYDTKAVRGVQQHVNPFDGHTEQVPNEYAHAWVNPAGEHIFTNDPNYDPNVGSSLHWEPMAKKD